MEPGTLVFSWWLLAFITAGIAQGKGRSGLNWFILSFLFGPLALVALVMFFSNIPQPPVKNE